MRYLGRFLWLLFTIVTVALAMAFATSNGGLLALHLWPYEAAITGPVWLFILGGIGIGTLFGGFFVWMSFLAIRTRHWRLTQKMIKTEKRAAATEEKLATLLARSDHTEISDQARLTD